jgi:hypothetical protein
MKKNKHKPAFNKSDYGVIMKLYYLNKREMKKEARVSLNDFQREVVTKKTKARSVIHLISIRRAIVKIAAMW